MRLCSFRRRCQFLSPIRSFDRPRQALLYVGVLGACYRLRPSRGEPLLDLGKVPNDAARRKGEALRKFATAFHFVDRAVSQRHHLAELVAPDTALDGYFNFAAHG